MSHGLAPGAYRTPKGSDVRVGGRHGNCLEIEFDWFEEDACIEAEAWVQDGELVWECCCCGVFSAPLTKVESDGDGDQVRDTG
jgi:hypothetical protein